MSEMHSEIQRHGIMYLVSSMGITIIGFLATIFYAHWVGPSVLGAYLLFVSFFNILVFIADFGIGYAGTQRICEGKDPDSFFTASLAIRLALYALLVTVLVIFREQFVDLNQTGLFWVLIGVIGIATLQTSFGIAISASNRLGLAASTTLLNNITRIVVQVIAVFLGFQVYGLVGGLVTGILLELIIELKFIDYHFRKFTWFHVKSLFSFSSGVIFINAGSILFDNISLIIIAYFLTVSDVGIFGVCWTFSFFALFISTALVNTLYVKVSRWNAQRDLHAIAVSLSRATTYSLIFALPLLIGGILLGYNLLFYLYGASFTAGATALVIIIAMRVIQSVLNLYTNFLMATDHAKQAVAGILAGIVVNVILCILLIPTIGITGAAIGALVNVIISFFVVRKYLSRIIPVILEKTAIIHIILATTLMAIPLILLRILPLDQSLLQTFAMVVIGAITYFIILLKLDPPIRNDLFKIFKIAWIPK